MKNLELQNWEKILITFAAVLFLASFAAYVSGFPLRNYLFGLDLEQGQDEIGKVAKSGGTLKREMLGQADFKVIHSGSTLFVRDTIVTGDNTSATIQLNDGSAIDLGPRTMVKLEDEGHSSLLGVTRTTRVEVVTGQVTPKVAPTHQRHIVIQTRDKEIEVASDSEPKTIQVSAEKPVIPPPRSAEKIETASVIKTLVSQFTGAKSELISTDSPPAQPSPVPSRTQAPVAAPSPSPSPSPTPSPSPSPKATEEPWTVQIVSPAQDSRLKPDQTVTKTEKTVAFSWKVSLKQTPSRKPSKGAAALSLRLSHLKEDGEVKKVIFEKSVTTAYGKTETLHFTITEPGKYEFQASGGTHASSKVHFRLENVFQGIELIQPETIGFNKNENIKDRGRRIAKVRLSWKPFPEAKTYKLKLYDQSSGTEKTQELSLKDTAYVVSRQSAAQQEMFYEVTTTLPNGFTVHSAKEKFIFDFPPPDPTTPPSKSKVTPQDMEAWEGGVLLTWQQTGVSEGYVIEVAQDAKFSKVLTKRSQKDNFFLFHPVKGIQRYWWRVSAYAHQLTSRPSQVFEFTTTGMGSAKSSTESGQGQIHDQKPDDQEI